jgi:hypothetical protein
MVAGASDEGNHDFVLKRTMKFVSDLLSRKYEISPVSEEFRVKTLIDFNPVAFS